MLVPRSRRVEACAECADGASLRERRSGEGCLARVLPAGLIERDSALLTKLDWSAGDGSAKGRPDQRHIRQHMTAARPGIIMPACPGASKEVRERVGAVMFASKADVLRHVNLGYHRAEAGRPAGRRRGRRRGRLSVMSTAVRRAGAGRFAGRRRGRRRGWVCVMSTAVRRAEAGRSARRRRGRRRGWLSVMSTAVRRAGTGAQNELRRGRTGGLRHRRVRARCSRAR